jgi:hypothetical protein
MHKPENVKRDRGGGILFRFTEPVLAFDRVGGNGEKMITSSSDTTSQAVIPVFESKFLHAAHIFIVI